MKSTKQKKIVLTKKQKTVLSAILAAVVAIGGLIFGPPVAPILRALAPVAQDAIDATPTPAPAPVAAPALPENGKETQGGADSGDGATT